MPPPAQQDTTALSVVENIPDSPGVDHGDILMGEPGEGEVHDLGESISMEDGDALVAQGLEPQMEAEPAPPPAQDPEKPLLEVPVTTSAPPPTEDEPLPGEEDLPDPAAIWDGPAAAPAPAEDMPQWAQQQNNQLDQLSQAMAAFLQSQTQQQQNQQQAFQRAAQPNIEDPAYVDRVMAQAGMDPRTADLNQRALVINQLRNRHDSMQSTGRVEALEQQLAQMQQSAQAWTQHQQVEQQLGEAAKVYKVDNAYFAHARQQAARLLQMGMNPRDAFITVLEPIRIAAKTTAPTPKSRGEPQGRRPPRASRQPPPSRPANTRVQRSGGSGTGTPSTMVPRQMTMEQADVHYLRMLNAQG